MTETPTIFDNYASDIRMMSKEEIHEKRINLENLVFGVLKRKYGDALEHHFLSFTPTTSSNKCIYIIERRVHPNLQFILHNIAMFGEDWCLGIICSDVNQAYCKEIVGKHINKIQILPLFKGSPDRDTARLEYNTLLKSASFYERLPFDHLCFVQTDSYFLRKISDDVLDFDFIGAMTAWNKNSMVGGLTFRNRAAMLKICREFQEDYPSEDVHINSGCKHFGMRMPVYEQAAKYVIESFFSPNPLATHQWWTFYSSGLPYATEIFQQMFHLDIPSLT